MIGLVLAAGAGRRLRPDTDSLPKALLEVAPETTILDIALRNLAAVGLTDVVVVVGYAAEAVQARCAALERRHGVSITLVHNDKAEIWNNAYSLWVAREHFADGVLMVNGDTVHPVSVEQTLLAAAADELLIAVDIEKQLAEEEMKVVAEESGPEGALRLTKITKLMDPADAYGEYIGATLIPASVAGRLADALQATFQGNPDLYYEDGFQHLADHGEQIRLAPIPSGTRWVEVDNHDDLARAREIACHY
ncbi:MAG: NTP transferase domain-containing protein [Nocardioidaceae bacterium]